MDTPQGLHGVSVRLPMGTPQGLHGVSVRLSMTRLTWNFCHNYGETIRLTWSGRFFLSLRGQDLHGAVVSVCVCVCGQDLHEAVVSVCRRDPCGRLTCCPTGWDCPLECQAGTFPSLPPPAGRQQWSVMTSVTTVCHQSYKLFITSDTNHSNLRRTLLKSS